MVTSCNHEEVSQTTCILDRIEGGDAKASEELLPLVYNELRRLAAHKLAHESPGQTLQPTALVHEAWIRLAGGSQQRWRSRNHFFAAAAESIRRILIENARRKGRVKHGQGLTRVDLADLDLAVTADDEVLLSVDAALQKLSTKDHEKAELVKLRFFIGLSIPEAARELGISETTAKQRWVYCRAWLYDELTRNQ
jgi:RNA polymerase sigma factor (TIGR02999 family)